MDTKISIITINYNNKEGLANTIKSVLSQTYLNLEYIVIDGGSKDGSEDIIRAAEKNISYWISEQDNGVYNAQNKGIKKATGDYCLFLNSGDLFYNAHSVEDLVNSSKGYDIVYGNIIFKSGNSELIHDYPSILSFDYFVKDTIPHPGTLIRRALFMQYGMYKEDIKICADWAFFIDAICKYNVRHYHLNKPITIFFLGGLSSREDSAEKIAAEKNKYLSEHYPAFIEEFKKSQSYKNKLNSLRRSRLIRLVCFFSKKIETVLFN
jgi:glycosyltransferase involved in cell wall biosynthesis